MSGGPLISAQDLLEINGDASVRVADTRWYLGEPDRGHRAYHEGHIPGATYVSLAHHLSTEDGPGRHPLPDREAFAECMGSLGCSDEHLIVAYDDRRGAVAARLWWMLRDIGHTAVRVLDGGIQSWLAAGGALETEPPSPIRAAMTVSPSLTRRLDRHQVADGLGELSLIDARTAERFRGDEEPIDPVAGHIPTAANAPYEGNLAPDGTFLDPASLRRRYEPLGGSGDAAVYCGSGVTACHDVLAITLAGLPEPALYPGSWSDWCTSGMPIAVGEAPR